MREHDRRRLLAHALQKHEQCGHLRAFVFEFLALFLNLGARLTELLLDLGQPFLGKRKRLGRFDSLACILARFAASVRWSFANSFC